MKTFRPHMFSYYMLIALHILNIKNLLLFLSWSASLEISGFYCNNKKSTLRYAHSVSEASSELVPFIICMSNS